MHVAAILAHKSVLLIACKPRAGSLVEVSVQIILHMHIELKQLHLKIL